MFGFNIHGHRCIYTHIFHVCFYIYICLYTQIFYVCVHAFVHVHVHVHWEVCCKNDGNLIKIWIGWINPMFGWMIDILITGWLVRMKCWTDVLRTAFPNWGCTWGCTWGWRFNARTVTHLFLKSKSLFLKDNTSVMRQHRMWVRTTATHTHVGPVAKRCWVQAAQSFPGRLAAGPLFMTSFSFFIVCLFFGLVFFFLFFHSPTRAGHGVIWIGVSKFEPIASLELTLWAIKIRPHWCNSWFSKQVLAIKNNVFSWVLAQTSPKGGLGDLPFNIHAM